MTATWRVTLLIESSRAYGRGILRGIARYARTHGHWSILHQEWTWDDGIPTWLTKGCSDGIIARIETPEMLKALHRLGVPVVDVRETHHLPDIPVIGTDNRRTTEMAVEHLLEQGFRNLAFIGFSGVEYSVRRRDHFVAILAKRRIKPLVYEDTAVRRSTTRRRENAAMLYTDKLGAWIASLPKPVGLMACNDIRGRQVLSACQVRGLIVPDQVAVIGVDNDEVLCELADPPLSSVAPATERIGEQAAAILDQMMATRGLVKRVPSSAAQYIEIEPLGVVTRQSSDVVAIENPKVSATVRFIRQHACEGIDVEDVLDHLAANKLLMSRTALDRHFTAALGFTPKNYILRMRLRRVKQLLMDTDYTLAKIAELVGIENPEYLSVMFKHMTGQAPGAFRRQFKLNEKRQLFG